MSGHFGGGLKGSDERTFFRLSELGINGSPLRGCVLVVGVWESRAIDDHLRRNDDLAALKRKFN